VKFYKMKNGDIVTDIHVSTERANAIKATRVFDSKHKTYCCDSRVYFDGVHARLNSAQAAVLTTSLNMRLRKKHTLIPRSVPKSSLTWLGKAKALPFNLIERIRS
jgi:hypothetical protein